MRLRQPWRIALLALFGALITFHAHAGDPARASVVFYTLQGEVARNMEIASTPLTRAHGLMDRSSLTSDGMLFVFPSAQDTAFWMKDTRLPLDMVFIAPDYTIVHIEHNARPQTLQPRQAGKPVIAVAELAGGEAEKLHIRKGDKVRYVLPEGQDVK